MAAPTAQDVIYMGFSAAMFGFGTDSELEITVRDLLTEQTALVQGEIGTTIATLTGTNAVRATRAIKLLTAADLCRMRINRLAQEVKQEDGSDANKMRNQLREYIAEAQGLIANITNTLGATSGFAAGSVISSHFDRI